ncbi:hypothetical protein GG681_09605 [Epibacterium sp. SM1969]|uniref:CENP-V/GFA domain-containing protein n=1 Tax=Tritonibacter aquimaris TaxID=2663379 RepID=A0A844AU30_9RHOB|nr:DUF6151 family protein [Tritonibacter aquimaris]MQY42898.1 hypothetical protein [Tritonibacter aquimaris]
MAPDTKTDSLSFSCTCGKLQGRIAAEAVKAATPLVCYCPDCRANELYHSQPDPDGVALVQTSPEAITFTQGAEHLQVLRLSSKGILRWYADCCGQPVANTLARPKLPFVGMKRDLFQDPDMFGKTKVKAFMPVPGKPARTKGALTMVMGIFRRMGSALLSGRWRDNPFFDTTTGEPVQPPEILDKDTRAALYKR